MDWDNFFSPAALGQFLSKILWQHQKTKANKNPIQSQVEDRIHFNLNKQGNKIFGEKGGKRALPLGVVESANKTQVLTVYNFDFSAVTISTIFWDHELHTNRCEFFDIEVTDPDQIEHVDSKFQFIYWGYHTFRLLKTTLMTK